MSLSNEERQAVVKHLVVPTGELIDIIDVLIDEEKPLLTILLLAAVAAAWHCDSISKRRNPYFPVVKLISVFLPPVWPSWVMKREPITAKPYWWDGSRRKTTSKVLSSRQA